MTLRYSNSRLTSKTQVGIARRVHIVACITKASLANMAPRVRIHVDYGLTHTKKKCEHCRQNTTVRRSKHVNLPSYLAFTGPCIANILAEYNQQDATLLNLFISTRCSPISYFVANFIFCIQLHILYPISCFVSNFIFCTQFNILYPTSYFVSNFIFCIHFHILYPISYFVSNFIFCTQFHILYPISYFVSNFIFCIQLHIL